MGKRCILASLILLAERKQFQSFVKVVKIPQTFLSHKTGLDVNLIAHHRIL